MSLRRRALFLAGLFVAVSCSDAGNPLEPGGPPKPGPEPDNVLQALDCSVNVQSGAFSCASAQPNTGQALGAGELIIGNQGTYVTLAASNFSTAADTVAFDVTVKNQIVQPLGTENGTTLDSAGVRVFFFEEPTGNPGGTAGVANADGQKIFLNGNSDPFYQYDEILSHEEVSPAKRWKLTYTAGATSIRFKVYVAAKVQHENGWVTVTPAADTLAPGESAPLTALVRNRAGQPTGESVTWGSSNTSVATVDGSGQVTGVGTGTATITASTGTRTPGTATIVVNTNPSFVRDSIGALGNLTITEPAPGVLQGASDGDGQSVAVVADTVTTDEGGTAWLNADGSFEYLSAPGFSGRDTIRFEITDGVSRRPAFAIADVQASNYWYVKPGGTGDGRDRFPFGTLGAAQASAGTGDTLFVLANGVQQVDGAVTLEANQAIIGQGIPASITREVNGQTITVLEAGSAPALTNTAAGATITLGTDNVIRGVGITAGGGAAISGTGFGTLFVRNVAVNPAGPALHLSTGAVDAIFDVLSSTGSGTTGLSLTDVSGTLTGTAGAISGATGTAFHVSGGSADISYAGSITSASGAVTSISGRTGGALTLSGTLTATGSGISVTGNSGGTIAFTGASKSITTANNAGVTVTGNNGTAVSFNGGELDVTTTSGAAFTASGGGTVTVTGAGNSLASTTGTALALDGVSTGASGVSFASVSADGAANGILLSGVTGAGVQVNGGTIQNTSSHGVQLASLGTVPVELAGLSITGTIGGGNAGIFAASTDSLQVAGVTVNVSGGPALSLSDASLADTSGTGAAAFAALGSSGSTSNGVILTDVGGSFTAAAGTIGGAASTAFAVAGGSVTATFAGNISQGNNAPLLAVSGNHSGSLTFNTGTLGATNGTGLQFNDAQGTYAFNGTTTLNGGDAGIDITNSSTGTFTFAAGTSVTSPTGSAFVVYGASPTVTYNGNLTKANAGLLVEVGEQPGGSVTFQNGTLSATTGTGISLSNADGAVSFNGTTTLNGGDAGVDVVSGSGGAIAFGANTRITTPSGIALRVANGGAETNVTFAGKIASSATGLAAHVEGVSGGTVTVSDSVGGTQGILVQNNTGGTITFSGAKSLSTGTANAVTLLTNTGATIGFTNGNTDLTTTTGTAFAASGGGTLNVSGAGSDITTTGAGAALTLSGVTLGASGMEFATVSTGAALAPVSLTNVGVTTGSAITVAGGSIPAANGTRFAVSGGAVNVNWAGSIAQATHNAALVSVASSHTGTLAFSGALSATSGTGLQFSAANGTYNFTGTTTLNGGDAGVDIIGGSAGTFSFGSGTAITSPSGTGFAVNGSSPAVTYNGNITYAGTGRVVDVTNQSGGTITFQGGTLGATAGTGILLSNADGAVSFSGTATLNGGDAGIDVESGSTGTIAFGGGASVTNATNELIRVVSSAPTFTYSGSFQRSTGNAVGILAQSNTGGSMTFDGDGTTLDGDAADEVKSLNTGTGGAVNLVNNSGMTIAFSGGGLGLTTTSGAAFSATGGGTLSVTGAGNTVSSGTGAGLNVQNTSIGATGLTFRSISVNGAANAVVLTNTGTTNGLQVTGDGSTAGSGGTIQNTTGTAISISSAANVQLALMNLQPDASGWVATNLSGTNKLERSTVDYLNTAPAGAFAFRVANTSTNSTIALDGTTFQNKLDGSTAVSLSAMGNSQITFSIVDSNTGDGFASRYRNLFGSGAVISSGDDVGSTAIVTANVSNTTFQDAPANGLTNLELGVTQNATLVPNVNGNVFDKVGMPLATVGVINVNVTVMGRVGSNATTGVISNNVISNIRSGAGPTFAYSASGTNGYVGMRVAIDNDAGGVNHKLQILNNTITEVARQGLIVSARGAANNVNIRVEGNTIGTLANPVGTASARRGVEIEAQTTSTLKIAVVNNPSIVGGTSASNSALHIRAGVNTGATSTVNATVTGNTIQNPNAGTNDGRFRAETVSGNSGTMCLDLRSNSLESASKEFQTNNNGGTYNRNASGNTGTITTIGTVGAVASCPLPSF